jgi:Circularly permutated YpsA SLOG family
VLDRVVSGGQTGADQAGWRAARAVGLATGGWMPYGFLTEAEEVRVLSVAGNRESTDLGIGEQVERFLLVTLQQLYP